MDTLSQLYGPDLAVLASALRSGRLAAPYSPMAVQRFVSSSPADQLAADLQALAKDGFTELQLARLCELLAKRQPAESLVERLVELVTTGPETNLVTNRDTSIVVRELFANANKSVLLAGYAVYRGQRVFEALARRMEEVPKLKVRFLLDIQRPHGDQTLADVLVKRFVTTFKSQNWPDGVRLPEVYYDPRSLELSPDRRASLHAKCVVVDDAEAFISSANFTEAAHQRNIEVGLLIKLPTLATRLSTHFHALVDSGLVNRAC
jgi:phosphatidylserine/phosphatidylglycerophosphate/cardiolipin synthase-like enzyme